jgi:ubiquinone/menaquinone biosynthesis C-methylase UbiE
MSGEEFATIAEAFSLTAEKYDQFAEDHPHLSRLRSKVYAHLSRFLPEAGSVLELNSGTGIDAAHLAQAGYRVHATDISPGMLALVQRKRSEFGLADRLTVQRCSFTDLGQVQGVPYDAVFSNLGGLNCIADLRPIIEQLPLVLRSGGIVTWVLMPRICLWEVLAGVFSGQFRTAFRRLSRKGTTAHLEGKYFKIYYFSPREVIASFSSVYKLLSLEGLSVITPPAESRNLAKRHPRIYNALARFDDRLSRLPPWWGWGDFFIISFRYEPD